MPQAAATYLSILIDCTLDLGAKINPPFLELLFQGVLSRQRETEQRCHPPRGELFLLQSLSPAPVLHLLAGCRHCNSSNKQTLLLTLANGYPDKWGCLAKATQLE